MLAAKGQLDKTPIEFEPSGGVEFGGALFLLPPLLATGLLSFQKHYSDLPGYYDLRTIIITLAFMYLCRIKSPGQLKHISPGEFGKLLGLDRIPEAKNLRSKMSGIVNQKQAMPWNRALATSWAEEEETAFFYVDGHVKVYSGYKANLGEKHISRLKLCLPGMMESWVNNSEGMPYFVVTGEVNGKMQEIILDKILPELPENVAMKVPGQQLKDDPSLPRFTLVFDREVSSPEFFAKLWTEYRVAILTYKKNVKDKWPESGFAEHQVEIDLNKVKMELCEKDIEWNNVKLREIRKKSNSYQTSIITTNKKLATISIAIKMFSRWTQENFFKYLRHDYDLDRIVHYIVNETNDDFKVVDPPHRKLTNKLKKTREKIARRKAILYELANKNLQGDADKTERSIEKQAVIKEELTGFEADEKELLEQRSQQPYKITIAEMQEEVRYNKLDIESKLFQNIIKMICYRAETSFSVLLAANYKKKTNEMRSLAKSLINTKANITPDYKNDTLTVELYSLSTPRDNKAALEVCQTLNDSQTIFPGTNLKLIYKIATLTTTKGQEF